MYNEKYYFLEDIGSVVSQKVWNKVKGAYPEGYEEGRTLIQTDFIGDKTFFVKKNTLSLYKFPPILSRSGCLCWDGEIWCNSCLDSQHLLDTEKFIAMEFI